jgi:D-sedoheptulose 7-phosphate isomerase
MGFMDQLISDYSDRLAKALSLPAIKLVPHLAEAFKKVWDTKKTIYLCGNGGSAGNANHLANDFLYGAGVTRGIGLRIESLSANPAVLTCLANDLGYEEVYAEQLRVKADPGDVLLVFSGSGNSPNVVRALEIGNKLGMETFAILGFSGGKCKDIAKHPLHFAINDMQIAEDLQLIIGHMIMQWLCDSEDKSKN